MTQPQVSVLLPVRNGGLLLTQALRSILRQSFTNWELVAVDDGSTDQTSGILHEAAADPRVRVLSPGGVGLVAALNVGLAACRAPFVARMDADDVSHPRRLELQYRYLSENPDVDVAACRFRHFPRHHLRRGMLLYEEWQNSLSTHDLVTRDLFVESPFVHPSVMFRKAAVEAAGGYHDHDLPEDYELWLRLAGRGSRFARLPETLFFWRDSGGRLTRTSPRYSPEAFRECKLLWLKQGYLEGEEEVVLAGAGLEGRAWSRTLAKSGIRVKLWLDVDPRKQRRVLHGAEVVPPSVFCRGMGKLLVTIGTPGAREHVRKWAEGAGLEEGVDFVCVT